MAPRSVTVNRVLLKLARASGWVLLALVSLFIVTGYALAGQHGLDRLIGSQLALTVHRIFDVPLLVFFGVHAATVIYFALRRWGVIKNGKRARRARLAVREPAE
jgi:cytochrome b subunit of formate dehydrogenase